MYDDPGCGAFAASVVRRVAALTLAVFAAAASDSAAQNVYSVDYGGYRPHYQGYGVETRGGRGGAICKVTSLSDAAWPAVPGTFRHCVENTAGARFVIFEVGGTIDLVNGPITITSPYLTIAGQTAPSPGILLRAADIRIDTHDIVMQHFRIRVGNAPNTPSGVWIRNDADNIVLDHLSVSWSVHNSIILFAEDGQKNVGDVTILDSIVSEALFCSGVHAIYPCDPDNPQPGQWGHSRAMVVGDNNRDRTYNNGVTRVAFIRTISANNMDRHPAIQGGVHAFHVNNLIYNPSQTPYSGIHFSDGYRKGALLTVSKGNLLLAGPTTPGQPGYDYSATDYADLGEVYYARVDSSVAPGTKIFLDGNYYAKHCEGTVCLQSPTAQWMLAFDSAVASGVDVKATTPPLTLANLPLSSVMPYTQVEAYLTANAGARPLDRDAVDARIVNEITSRTGSVPDRPSEKAGPGTAPDGFPILASTSRALTVPSNPHAVVDAVGRTRIEAWLEDYARALEPGARGASHEVPSAPQNLRLVP